MATRPRRRRATLDAMDRVGDTQGETGAVDIKETRIEVGGLTGSVSSPASDEDAIRQKAKRVRVRRAEREFDE